jgi:arylformamidase
MRFFDITQPLGVTTAVWPGDHAPEIGWVQRLDAGDAVNVAVATFSVHTGTHIDGTYHFRDDGLRAGEMPLEPYIGPALVVEAAGHDTLDAGVLDDVDLRGVERILFRTRPVVDETTFPDYFAHIEPSLARRLGEIGVRLVGTDAPSVDPVDSRSLEAHHLLAQGGIAILENVVLAHVAPGRYFLVALPLRLVEADSSPVRAVLLQDLQP